MAYEVITQGGGEGLVYTFNAIAALFKGPRGFVGSLVYIGGSFATAIMVMTLVIKQELLPTAKWFFGSLIMMTALMLPKVDILIKDRITHLQAPVANVPFVLGAFAGIASQLGDMMAERFDSLFSRSGGEVMNYRIHGVAMASQLAAKANSFTIPNPDAAANVKGFVQNCMVFDIAKGKYSIDELLNSRDTWAFLKEQASPIRGFPYRVAKHNSQILTCQQAAVEIEKTWRKNLSEAANRYGSDLFPHQSPGKKAAAVLLSNLGLSYQYLTGLSLDAALILRQNLMRQTIEEGLLELNAFHDSSAAVTAYAVARAQAQQKTAYALQGKMASLSLSTLKIVVEVLFYGIFPIIVAIAVFPGGLGIVKKYLIALFWIQSWAPMYSILNMLVNVYGKAKSVAAVTLPDGTTKALAFSTIHRLGEANEWVAAVAGYAMMSVPFLSYGIIHYGAGALSQLATHFGSITQSSASHASEEATTGNYQMGNTSFDNHNRSNTNAFKYDTNTSVAAGKQTAQQLEGSLLHKMPNGKFVLDKRPAISELGASFNESRGISLGLNKMAEESHRAGMAHLASSQTHLSSALSEYQGIVKNYQTGENLTKTWAQGTSVMRDSAFSQLDAISYELAKALNIELSAANHLLFGGKLSAGAGAKAGVGTGKSGKLGGEKGGEVNANANLNTGYTHQETTLNARQHKAAEGILEKYDIQELIKKAQQESKEGRYALVDAQGNQYDTGIRANLDHGISKQELAQASFTKEGAYREAVQLLDNTGVESSQNLSQAVFDQLVAELGGPEKALEYLEKTDGLRQTRGTFIGGHQPKLEQTFKEKTMGLTPDKLEKQHEQNAKQIEAKHDPKQQHQDNTDKIIKKADEKELRKPIPKDLINTFENRLEHFEKVMTQAQNEHKREKTRMIDEYKEFKEDNPANDYSTAFKNLFSFRRWKKTFNDTFSKNKEK